MNTRKNMIIAKGKIVTAQVDKCIYDSVKKKWNITFDSGKTYEYSQENIIWLKDPKALEPRAYRIQHNEHILGGIASIDVFRDKETEYWHICFENGKERDYPATELRISRSILERADAKKVFAYLREIAGLISVKAEDDTAILEKQYEKINYLDENTAAAAYLAPEKLKTNMGIEVPAPIFPFGCNASQFQAVKNALSHQISVVEGPPGTGKTQTILNIIANLIIQDCTVQVVSNNNSAIENVIEKLESPEYELGFIAALLGRRDRKITFIGKQSGTYPNLSSWKMGESELQELLEKVRSESLRLQTVYHSKIRLAELKQEKSKVELEREHYDALGGTADVPVFRKKVPAVKLMGFWQEYQDILDGTKKAGLLYCIIRWFTHSVNIPRILKEDPCAVTRQLQMLYYDIRIGELKDQISGIEKDLEKVNADVAMKGFSELSMQCLRAKIAEKYHFGTERRKFTEDDLWRSPDDFLIEYPVVLSTTYTARSSLGKAARYDYVIMDEASQVDIATGTLAISCAGNAVIVGDTKQLPNVVTTRQKKELDQIFAKYNIPKAYNFSEYSFLKSICSVLGKNIPRIILREHYRCHPQIIGFCNEKFYDGELVVMTSEDHDNALTLVTTVAGSHERERMNQRQIDVIKGDILPLLRCQENQIGIIAPYNNQVNKLIEQIGETEIEIATVHKFQGREKDTIILSTVDDRITDFSDDPNLLNVAVSRAKKKLIVVASEEEQPVGSNVGDLIGYIRYHNCDIQRSQISSVFDYLYRQYTEQRLEYLKKHKRISEYDSENLMHALIEEELAKCPEAALGVISHQPLWMLFTDTSALDEEEQKFVNSGLSHLDFLIYNMVTKQPLLAIEVDGFQYHKEGTRQWDRDRMKDRILEKYGLPLLRFTTNGSNERQILAMKLKEFFA